MFFNTPDFDAATGLPKDEVLKNLTEQTSKRRWELEFAAIPEGPFYRPRRLGEQKRLIIHTDHPFYTKIYDAAPEVRGAIEVLPFVLAERELEVKNELRRFAKLSAGPSASATRWTRSCQRRPFDRHTLARARANDLQNGWPSSGTSSATAGLIRAG